MLRMGVLIMLHINLYSIYTKSNLITTNVKRAGWSVAHKAADDVTRGIE